MVGKLEPDDSHEASRFPPSLTTQRIDFTRLSMRALSPGSSFPFLMGILFIGVNPF
jgi:hypothetical protein